MKGFVKFDNDLFYYKSVDVQLSIDDGGDVDFEFDISKYPEYKKTIIKLFDNTILFDLTLPRCKGERSFIKMMNIDNDKMVLYIRCNKILHVNAKDHRNKVIGEILESKKQS